MSKDIIFLWFVLWHFEAPSLAAAQRKELFQRSSVINSSGQRLHISFSFFQSHVMLTWPVCVGQHANVHIATQQCRTGCTVSAGFKQAWSIIWCVNKLNFYSVSTWWLWSWMQSCLFAFSKKFSLQNSKIVASMFLFWKRVAKVWVMFNWAFFLLLLFFYTYWFIVKMIEY